MNLPGLIVAHGLCMTAPAPLGEPADAPPVVAPAPPDDADASTLFRQGRYPEAAAAFEREYASNPDPALLFGRAVALQRSGDCFAAIEGFEAFIAVGPPAPDVAEGNRQIEQCRQIIEANAEQQRAPAPQEPATPPPRTLEPERDAPTPWHRDRLGGALVGVGAAMTVTGAVLYGAAFGIAGRDQPGLQTDHEARSSSTRSMAAAGLSVLAVGGAVAIAGAIRWTVVARQTRRRSDVRATLLRSGAVIRF